MPENEVNNINPLGLPPKINISNASNTSKQPFFIKFIYQGHALQLAQNYVGLIQLYYEGEKIMSSISQVQQKIKAWGDTILIPEDPQKFSIICTKKLEGFKFTECKFMIGLRMKDELVPGIYFISTKIYDSAGQPYVEQYLTFRVPGQKPNFNSIQTNTDDVKIEGNSWADKIEHDFVHYVSQKL